jgi:hypothetical protein
MTCVFNFKLLHKLHDVSTFDILKDQMVHSKTHPRSTSTHKVINHTFNGTMLHYFFKHTTLTFDLLCFECIKNITLVLKTNTRFFNPLIIQTCLIFAKVL